MWSPAASTHPTKRDRRSPALGQGSELLRRGCGAFHRRHEAGDAPGSHEGHHQGQEQGLVASHASGTVAGARAFEPNCCHMHQAPLRKTAQVVASIQSWRCADIPMAAERSSCFQEALFFARKNANLSWCNRHASISSVLSASQVTMRFTCAAGSQKRPMKADTTIRPSPLRFP